MEMKIFSVDSYNTMTSKYEIFMNNCKVNKDPDYTHVRMNNGSFKITKEKLPEFYELYYEHVIKNGKIETLVERQNRNIGPILIDFDFQYDLKYTNRCHNNEIIFEVINKYFSLLKNEIIFDENTIIPVYVMERKDPYNFSNKCMKDGFHIVIGIQIPVEIKQKIRNSMLETLHEELGNLPLIDHNYDKVFDNTIVSGKTGWMMIGSRKPAKEPYELTKYYEFQFDKSDEEFIIDEPDFIMDETNFMKMTAQYSDYIEFPLKQNNITKKKRIDKKEEINEEKEETTFEEYNIVIESSIFVENINKIINSIKNANDLQNKINEYIIPDKNIRNIHEYTQILPEKYYEPGSHLLNRKIAFALKNTDPRLFLSWIQLRSKAKDFSYFDIAELYRQWDQYFNNGQDNQLTANSIKYWAKQENIEEYIKINVNSLNDLIEETIKTPTDYDLAKVLHHMYKDYCICTDIKKKELYWYKGHHWKQDKGVQLRRAISNEMHTEYSKKLNQIIHESKNLATKLDTIEKTKEIQEHLKTKMKTISAICTRLKSTEGINKIMNESYYIFYDDNFMKMADENPFLLCFTNGVVDLKEKCFRPGKIDDYITKCTNIPFIFNKNDIDQNIVREIEDFLKKLFPIPELYEYMWDHMTSTLFGTNINGTLNIYKGDGANGKSLLQKILAMTLGDYCLADIKTTLITFRETDMEKASPTLNSLKGLRLALLQELNKSCKMNDKIVKNLATKEPMNIRTLYGEPYVMTLQAMFILSTNYLPSTDNVTDHGLARRLRIVPFLSKFIDDYDSHTKYKCQYTFAKDPFLDQKIPNWITTFAYMLVMNAFKTNGLVNSNKCKIVMEFSDKFMKEQDILGAFIKDCIVIDQDKSVNKQNINEEFKRWYSDNFTFKDTKPKTSEVHDYISEYFDIKMINNKWKGITIRVISDEDGNKTDDEIGVLEN